ncbi:transglutaminase-like domain-containing protein [Arthrobacter oryzae]|uniref:transglutaminase-like domain-containing protein n=1 Tax=Arthrobacter oryzae TaxID=409290 RepID=UPI00273BA467|nr:transglutaminase-like domain-containing protein [Arthrobacter oryzae]WLQ08343.1 transglutaminase-like domain-containing protein [Arthrobacter oryzae]
MSRGAEPGRPAGRLPSAVTASWPATLGPDAAALGTLLATGVLGFFSSFAGDWRFLLAGSGGIALGLVLALLAARLRLGVLLTLTLAVLAYLVFGSGLAAPGQAIAGVVPSPESLRTIIAGVVLSWKQLLTSAAPVGAGGGLLVVPFLAAYVAAFLAGTLAWRLRSPAWSVLPAAGLLLLATAMGTHETSLAGVRGMVFVAVSVAWLAYRRRTAAAPDAVVHGHAAPAPTTTAARLRRTVLTAGVLGLAGAMALAAAPALTASATRQILRDVVVPPLDLRDYSSPLASFRDYVKNQKDSKLLAVTGLPEGARIRLASLDSYDGVVFDVYGSGSSNFSPISNESAVGVAGTRGVQRTAGQAARAEVQVTVDAYKGVWVPSSGTLLSVDFGGARSTQLDGSLFFSPATDTAIATARLQAGDTYTMGVAYPALPKESDLEQADFAAVSLPPVESVPQIVAAKATEIVGDSSRPVERVRKLEAALSKQGAFSHGLDGEARSLSGHGAQRISAMLSAKQMVGDDEQYAVAMALMARELGIPARVVMGFYPDPKNPPKSGTVDITGDDVHAWVEVAFEGVGWVPFNPTPSEDNVPIPPDPQPKSKPQPQVLQPPPPPQAPVELPPDSAPEAQDAEQNQPGFWAFLGPILMAIGLGLIPVAVLLLPLALIAWLKLRRRKRRACEGTAADRIGGGWSEVMNTATDLGVRVPPGATRRENAASLGEFFPDSGSATLLLAHRADVAIFAAGDPSDDDIRTYWADVDSSLKQMTGSVGFWRRQRAKYSLRSLAEGGLGLQLRTLADSLRNRAGGTRGKAAEPPEDSRAGSEARGG